MVNVKTNFDERNERDRIEYSILPPGEFPPESETGAWRYRRPITNYETCIQCMRCEKFCPDVSIEIKDEKPVIDYKFCKGCGICVEECPADAISWEREAG